MDIQRLNLDNLISLHFDSSAQAALENISDLIRDRRDQDLAHMLRSHLEEDIDPQEATFRLAVDNLLDFCGILEIAFMVGHISQIPEGLSRRLDVVLGSDTVRKYYEEYYPLLLPQLFMKRRRYEYQSPQHRTTDAQLSFQQLLLSVDMIRDENIHEFLLSLSQGRLAKVINILTDPVKLNVAFSEIKSPEREVRAAMGFLGFWAYSDSFASMLDTMDSTPFLQSSFWHLHARWYGFMSQETLGFCRAVFGKYREMEKADSFHEESAVDIDNGKLMDDSLARLRKLTSAVYRFPLENEFYSLPSLQQGQNRFHPLPDPNSGDNPSSHPDITETHPAFIGSVLSRHWLMDTLQEGVAIFDASSLTITAANAAFAHFCRVKVEELIGTALTYWFDGDAQRDLKGGLDRLRKDRTPRFYLEDVRSHRGDETRWYELRAESILDAGRGIGYGVMIIQDITLRKKAEVSLREREVLLKHVHSRVKHNLLGISDLLARQSEAVTDFRTKQQLRESITNIRFAATAHDMLLHSHDAVTINFREYLQTLVRNIASMSSAPGKSIQLVCDADVLEIGIQEGIPAGLIVNELVMNALKYAYPGTTPGIVTIRLSKAGKVVRVAVEDYGTGLPPSIDVHSTGTLGLSLVRDLVTQLKGTFTIDRQNGTVFSVSFPSPDEDESVSKENTLEASSLLLEIVFELVKMSLSDWEDHDVRRYFELAYEDSDMRMLVRTDSAIAARTLAQGISDMIIERMRLLRAREERRKLPE